MAERAGDRVVLDGPTHFSFVRFLGDGRWDVECSVCDFTVQNLSSFEAANDTANWHEGKPSQIGDVLNG